MCLLAIRIAASVKYILRVLPIFYLGCLWIFFFLLSFENPLYDGDTSSWLKS